VVICEAGESGSSTVNERDRKCDIRAGGVNGWACKNKVLKIRALVPVLYEHGGPGGTLLQHALDVVSAVVNVADVQKGRGGLVYLVPSDI
jgi:hypothetical protein